MACSVAKTRYLRPLLMPRFTAALFAERRLHNGLVALPKSPLLLTSTDRNEKALTRRITNLTHGDRYRKGGIGTPNYDVITEPGNVSPMQYVPDSIAKPSYADSGIVVGVPKELEIKTEEQVARMRESCRLAKMVLSRVSKRVKVFYNGYHGDCAETLMVGHSLDERGKALVQTARECLDRAISICGPGQKFSEIGRVISIVAAQAGFTVVPAFCGHGIGTYFHGPPDIYHFDNDEKGEMLEGLVFTIESGTMSFSTVFLCRARKFTHCAKGDKRNSSHTRSSPKVCHSAKTRKRKKEEPVITEGSPDIAIMEDGWTTVTVDNSRTAQFEHTVYICNEGVEVLTVL
ncbi:methionine aminopeptidase 1D, mitochondrial isoform X3 [Dermacentor variabilis]|uniref:methionine aminopeptidase 1D, mitochondrial isoform X3 n=1 Tax=Dermacentor variabilis TaxID=34621 RepID=UPI003F5B5582